MIAEGMVNGRVVARQAKDALDKLFENVRADIIAEHFAKEHNASALFAAAKELEERAHRVDAAQIQTLSVEAKSILGVFADFAQVKRAALITNGSAAKSDGPPPTSDRKSPVRKSDTESNGQPESDAAEPPSKLL